MIGVGNIGDEDEYHESECCEQEAIPDATANVFKIQELTNKLLSQVSELEDDYRLAQEDIVMLKKYIVDNGLKPFWVPDGLKKSPQKMTVKELADANTHATSRQEGVKVRESKDSIPRPTYEEEAKMYEDRLKENGPEINWLVEACSKNEED